MCKQGLTFHLRGYVESNCCVYRSIATWIVRQIWTLYVCVYNVTRKFILYHLVPQLLRRVPNHERDDAQNSSWTAPYHRKVIKQCYITSTRNIVYRYDIETWSNALFSWNAFPFANIYNLYFISSLHSRVSIAEILVAWIYRYNDKLQLLS